MAVAHRERGSGVSTVGGLDLSTKAIDLCLIDENTGAFFRHHTWELGGSKDVLIERIRNIGIWFPGPYSAFWGDVAAVGIERPIGTHGAAQVSMSFGAVLSRLPRTLLVEDMTPPAWKSRVGLKGNAKKEEIEEWARQSGCPELKQPDGYDAFGIARATYSAVERVAA
jgi:hypothetical protein